MHNLPSRLNSIRCIQCFSHSLPAMALFEWKFMSDDDPWKVSAFISAIVELFLSILLLLGAAIAFITSRFAKFFGLEPPCTYVGCSHPLHSGECLVGQMHHCIAPSCKSKDLCRGEFYSDCRPLRIHSKAHYSNSASSHEEGSDAYESSDHNASEQYLDDFSGHYGVHNERRCSCSKSPRDQKRATKHTIFAHTASTSKLKKDDHPLCFSRSGSESSCGFDAMDHCEISQAPADLEEEWAWEGSYVKSDKNVDNYVPLALNSEAIGRNAVSEDFRGKSHSISLSLLERSQEEPAETLQSYVVHDDVKEVRVSENDVEHHKQEDTGRLVVADDAECRGASEHAEKLALLMSPLEAEDTAEDLILEEEQEEDGLDALKLALQTERSVLASLEAELENERNAAAVATNEAMAMISRLQEEKSAMQLEVAQLQRMSEEKAEYDEQAMALLKEILYKREKENIALEKEVELYRETLSDELKRSWLSEGSESPSPQSLKPLLLTSGEELPSPIEDMKQKQALLFPEMYQCGTRRAPWIQQHGPGSDSEKLNAFSLDQNVNRRTTDFPMNDTAASMSFRVGDEEGRQRCHLDGHVHGPGYNSEQLEKSKSVFSTNEEEIQSALQRLWVLEEELQKLRGKDSLKENGSQQLGISSTHGSKDKSVNGTWGGQIVHGIKSKEQREEAEMDGIAEGGVPIHDVYEVQSSSNRSPPFAERDAPPEGFEGISGNLELLSPGGISESFLPAARIARNMMSISPRISPATKSFPPDEALPMPSIIPQGASWILGKCLHAEDVYNQQELQAHSAVLREESGTMKEDIQQLAARLKALEEDRELLRESLESFKHRDAELDLLQEIARRLREIRMAGFVSASGGIFSEDITVTSPSKNRAVKKRRCCSGPGQAQMPLLYQKSV